MGLNTLGYRPWQGTLRGSWVSPWPISRIALQMVFRRKLFWLLYALGLFNFLVFFGGIYLFYQIDVPSLVGSNTSPRVIQAYQNIIRTIQEQLYMAGTKETYRNFIWLQGYIVMAVLALAGALLIGNDYQYGSLPFYLSKPLGRWHYLFGKFLAVALFVNMLTTLPALVLFGECALMEGWSYVERNAHLLPGILGYGAILSVCLGLLVLAVAAWLRKTVPLMMVWVGILFFGRVFADALVDGLQFDPRWRLMDLWNNMYLLGSWCLDAAAELESGRRFVSRPQPEPWEAALVLLLVCAACLVYLDRRIRAVEIVR
jgi:ABC-type transport system involved in multi-copper enzyme maturation permease subunit